MNMDFFSPTHGKLSFDEMFRRLVGYIEEEPDQQYHLIIGTDSLLAEETTFVTAIVVHRVGHGGRYFYRKMRNRKMEIHLDVGERGETRTIIREVIGMVTGSGFAAVTKPDAYGASKVADKHSK